jgi:glycosyltransferase involved in cell wall biosynthesis
MVYSLVIPVYEDWESFAHLIREVDAACQGLEEPLHIIAVNDGSSTFPPAIASGTLSPTILNIECVHLMRNLGHQRAIVVGLITANDLPDCTAVIIIDADGEDAPSGIERLVAAHRQHPDAVIAAVRGKRMESGWFKLFYWLYQRVFSLLTGNKVVFGNHCLIPKRLLCKLTHDSNLWNHVAAAITRSRLPVVPVTLNRAERYAGRSKMNFESLVLHGLSAISVFTDVVFVRLLLFSALIGAMAFAGVVFVVAILLFTNLAIPGWATSAVGVLVIIILQSIIFSSGAIFFVLNMRSYQLALPTLDVNRLIASRETIYDNR